MTRCYRRRDHASHFYNICAQVSEKEAVDQLAKNRAWRDEMQRSRLRWKRWAAPAYALMIVGAVMIVFGIVVVGRIDFSCCVLVTVLGVVAAAVGETFVLRLSAVTSQPVPAGPMGKKETPASRLPRRAVPGGILGLVVGLVCPFGLRVWDLGPSLFVLLVFFFGYVAAGIGLAVSYTSKEWREAESKRLALRLVMNTIICAGAILLVMELVAFIGLVEYMRHGYLYD